MDDFFTSADISISTNLIYSKNLYDNALANRIAYFGFMVTTIDSAGDLKNYYKSLVSAAQYRAAGSILVVLIFFCGLGYFSQKSTFYGLGAAAAIGILVLLRIYHRNTYSRLALFGVPFPGAWREILESHSVFYRDLNGVHKQLFEKRSQIFLAEKRIEGIGTTVDDQIRLLVAASGIIPTFAFPVFTYPDLHEVLVYPASFSRKFEIGGPHTHEENIEGMVGNGYMNHSLLLSKPALLAGFTGKRGDENVGIHEFVHLLDREDGETDGIPALFVENKYCVPWLHLIKKEMNAIRQGQSDINPYAITNNAEFLAVASEYFFCDPAEFQRRHKELYTFLSTFYGQRFDN